jgi:hypothetical protein
VSVLGPQRLRTFRAHYDNEGEDGKMRRLWVDYSPPPGQEFVVVVVGTHQKGVPMTTQEWREKLAAVGLRGNADEEEA